MKDNLVIQFNNPKLDQINDKQKSLILEKVKSIFLIKRSKISFSEYKRGSAFIKNNEKIKTQ